jgi:hypothetical protein
MMDENAIRQKLLARVLAGSDGETANAIMALGDEATVFRLLVVVARLDSNLSRGLLVIKYGVSDSQAKKARSCANRKLKDIMEKEPE